ncbi:radical SAM protein [Xylanibacter muris]|uniref:Radical SAM protein n=1 Tax=Xylanibacter muris TaxID=2736290 RepID=A0ABX2AM87_9BACT|nr:radical SAM protein [Xylanibacter muris]NPD92341.1 radical SAM protein [Xylanibacter muris]
MYSIGDYIRNGCVYLNNIVRPRHKTLGSLMIYSTTRCQSRCRHCSIWKKREENLSLDDIKRIMRSKCVTSGTVVGLEGGEFVLHPQMEEIMDWFMRHHPNYTLLSNCLAPKKVIDVVRKYRPAHLYVSLDGGRDTYKYMRGRDGYDKVIEVVEAVRDIVPVSLMFCLSPWNTFADMEFVINVAGRYGVDVRIGIYGTMEYFDVSEGMLATDKGDYVRQIPANIHGTDENYDFVALYDEWRNGNLVLPCHSIFSELVIHADGNVPLCQNLDVILGNIHDRSLDEIFNSPEACRMQCRYSKRCNGCWINFHRKYDIILLRNMERVLPKKAVEWFFGKYQWSSDTGGTYRQYFNKIK